MIQENEIRVNNLVLRKGSIVKLTIDLIADLFKMGIAMKMGFIQGIPLTKEIIGLMGFYEIENGFITEVHIQPLVLDKDSEGYHIKLSYGRVSKKPLIFLHELQNAYHAIAGRELEISESNLRKLYALEF